MQSGRVAAVLAVILAVSCLILGAVLEEVRRAGNTLPDSAVEDLISSLEESGISADPSLVSGKRETAAVYVLDSGDYALTVASLLSGSRPARTYAAPDGEIFLMENGARLDFGEDFSFRYSRGGERVEESRLFDMAPPTVMLSEERQAKVAEIVADFLDAGSGAFRSAGGRGVDVRCLTDAVWENDGIQYALCSRTVDGMRIAANRVICAIRGDEVTEAWGTWYFLTAAESYSAPLIDTLNILFNMKKEIGASEERVRVESVTLCYSLYFLGDREGFCLIPCWQVATDTRGSYLFNALDGTFYTNN
ncbi:MAG: hypothetical protein E7576_16060 [Ruminococcaceae bacterium]|jgi:hypothetical protein|nr:hypothetical protein [Oscillospiraceae bacterium]